MWLGLTRLKNFTCDKSRYGRRASEGMEFVVCDQFCPERKPLSYGLTVVTIVFGEFDAWCCGGC